MKGKIALLVVLLTVASTVVYAQNCIGIGTTDPKGYVDIVGDSNPTAAEPDRYKQLNIRGASNNDKMYIGIDTTERYAGIGYVREGVGWGPLVFNARGGGPVGIATTTPIGLFQVGSSYFFVNDDDNGGIEIGGNTNIKNKRTDGTPYVDFHYGTGSGEDYNMRIINSDNNELTITGPTGNEGTVVIPGDLNVGGDLNVAGKTIGFSTLNLCYKGTPRMTGNMFDVRTTACPTSYSGSVVTTVPINIVTWT